MGSAALYFDFAQLVDCPIPSSKWETIKSLLQRLAPSLSTSSWHCIGASIPIPPRWGLYPLLPSPSLPDRSKKLENVGSRKTVVMCQVAGTGLSLFVR